MGNSENKMSNEALADEALDQVAGGVDSDLFDIYLNCVSCGVVSKSSEFKQHNNCCPHCGAPRPKW